MSPWQLESVLNVHRNLLLKFHQNPASNSWDIADIEFVWVGGLHSHYIVKPNLVFRLGWGFDNLNQPIVNNHLAVFQQAFSLLLHSSAAVFVLFFPWTISGILLDYHLSLSYSSQSFVPSWAHSLYLWNQQHIHKHFLSHGFSSPFSK